VCVAQPQAQSDGARTRRRDIRHDCG